MLGHTAEAVAAASGRPCTSMHSGCHHHIIFGLQAIDKDAEKTMLAYYFKKQEEQKVKSQATDQHLLASPLRSVIIVWSTHNG